MDSYVDLRGTGISWAEHKRWQNGKWGNVTLEWIMLSNNMVRPWSAKRTVLVDADVKSDTLATAEPLFNLFTSRCQSQIDFYQINTSTPNITDFKIELNGLEVIQENCPPIMPILTESEWLVLYRKVWYELTEQLGFCKIIQNHLWVFWGWFPENFLKIISS